MIMTRLHVGGAGQGILLDEINGPHPENFTSERGLIGSAVYPADAKDWHDLIRLADAAMYCAKASGVEPPNQQARFSSSSMEDNSSTGTQSKFH